MAIYKIYHGSSSPASPWNDFATNAAQSMSALITAVAAGPGWADGDTVLVASNHQSATTADANMAITHSIRVISVNSGTGLYEAGGSLSVPGANNHNQITVTDNKSVTFRGIKFGATTTSYFIYIYGCGGVIEFHDCTFDADNTNGEIRQRGGTLCRYIDCTMYSATATLLRLYECTRTELINCSFPNESITSLLTSGGSVDSFAPVYICNCDLSNFGNIAVLGTNSRLQVDLFRCQLGVATTLWSGTPGTNEFVRASCCDTGQLSGQPLGLSSAVTSVTSALSLVTDVYRTASDGSNSISYQIDTSAAAGSATPAYLINRLAIWHDATASKTLTIYLMSDVSDLDDGEIEARAYWPDEADPAYPPGEYQSTLADYGSEAAAGTSPYLKTDTATWTGEGANTKYKFEIGGIAPKYPGWVLVDILFYLPSSTLWVCPDLALS